MNHNFCETWHKETHVDLLDPRQPIAALEQARQTERLASVNAGIFKKVRDVDRDVAAAHYYKTLLDDLAKARAQVALLEKEFPDKDSGGISSTDINGLKVHICTLVAPDSPPGNWMDVYVHSKLMIVDDVFTTQGSANINTRSMQVDSELNICIEDPAITRPLREHLFGVHAGVRVAGEEMSKVYKRWNKIILENNNKRTKNSTRGGSVLLSPPLASLVEFLQKSPARKNLD
ncbi:phospholipase D-like domain-containing protein [Pseudomonas silesiensis]|uniref:phospholipase D-like domain-containing protein n=1 Tax=Pseudomonas silesiensis TaxID=1853130 RepID=UPI0034D76BED